MEKVKKFLKNRWKNISYQEKQQLLFTSIIAAALCLVGLLMQGIWLKLGVITVILLFISTAIYMSQSNTHVEIVGTVVNVQKIWGLYHVLLQTDAGALYEYDLPLPKREGIRRPIIKPGQRLTVNLVESKSFIDSNGGTSQKVISYGIWNQDWSKTKEGRDLFGR